MASVSAAVTNPRSPGAIRATVAALRGATPALAGRGHELARIAAADPGGAGPVLDELRGSGVEILRGDTTLAQQRDAGARTAAADGVLFVEAGAAIGAQDLVSLLDWLHAHPRTAAVAPAIFADAGYRLVLHPLSATHQVAALLEGEREALADALYWMEATGPLEAGTLDGSVMLASRAALESAGPFAGDAADPVDAWCRRASAAGRTVVLLADARARLARGVPDREAWAARREPLAEAAGRHPPVRRGPWARWLRRPPALPEAADPSAPELVVADASSRLELPAGTERAFVQIGPDFRFEAACGGIASASGIDLSEALASFEPGEYALRLVDPITLETLDRRRIRLEARSGASAPGDALVTSAEIEIGPYREGDEHAILALWKKVFGKERELVKWRWLFSENPAGMHVMLARTRDGRVVAQFAGVQLRVQVRDKVLRFAHMVDSMSDPDCRQSLARTGLFTQTVLRYVETWGKPGEEAFGFGLPNRVAYRIGKRTQGYTDIFPLEWRARSLEGVATPPPGDGEPRVFASETIDPRVDRLWERVRPSYPVMTVRDATYLAWRYTRNPDRRYTILFAERAGELVGFAAGAAGFLDEPTFAVADWMLAPGEEEAGRRLLAACERAAIEAGATRILGSFLPAGSAGDRVLEEAGYELEKSRWRWVGRIYDPQRLDWDTLRTGFYLTLGDSDLA